jgi:hypothetical protein
MLEKLGALPSGIRESVGDATITASEKYQAASGFMCRQVYVDGGRGREARLACGDSHGWFFVPDVFRGEAAQQPTEPEVQLSSTGEAIVVDAGHAEGKDPGNDDHGGGPPKETP